MSTKFFAQILLIFFALLHSNKAHGAAGVFYFRNIIFYLFQFNSRYFLLIDKKFLLPQKRQITRQNCDVFELKTFFFLTQNDQYAQNANVDLFLENFIIFLAIIHPENYNGR